MGSRDPAEACGAATGCWENEWSFGACSQCSLYNVCSSVQQASVIEICADPNERVGQGLFLCPVICSQVVKRSRVVVLGKGSGPWGRKQARAVQDLRTTDTQANRTGHGTAGGQATRATKETAQGTLLSCLGCQNEIPQTGWLRNFTSPSLAGWKSEMAAP